MSRLAERNALVDRVIAYVDGSLVGEEPEPFGTLARAIHRFQTTHDPVQRALAEGQRVEGWRDIPGVPVDLFKDLPVGTVPEGEGRVFRTSGTTTMARGVHRLHDTRAYDHGAREWHRACVPDAPHRVVALLQDPALAPDSSLSHMVAAFGDVDWFLGADGLDVAGALAALRLEEPVYLCATAFALAELLDAGPAPLPAESVVMVTGGFKGRRQELSDRQLYEATAANLAPERRLREYGMTELSSQLWALGDEPYQPPPWLRVVALDPATGVARRRGEAGQLRFVDLCNVDAAVAVDTLDAGVVLPDGAVRLHGRLSGAHVRGCSLTVEELAMGEEP